MPFNCDQGLLRLPAKDLYFALLEADSSATTEAQARLFLLQQVDSVASIPEGLPVEITDLMEWMRDNTAVVGEQYQHYLTARRHGEGRRYFPTRSHALYFLKGVAPTKLVDGAWLYGLINQWRDARYGELIQIYLEELGEGDPEKNHVLIYKKLLAAHECTQIEMLDEAHFVQGAIQLALATHTSEFLPEVIGFNLGYEQLPLHLLICAYELNELGIDPYYFTLHVTIDNAATGHAARAVQAVVDAMPYLGDKEEFYQRIRNGYKLNSLGASTNQVIAEFDLEQELLTILATKATTGGQLHSDYCRIAGKTVNEWLAEPKKIHGFVRALEKTGWIRRHEPPDNSRFWNLLVGEKGPMFGVFNAYERQVIYDWIAGESLQASEGRSVSYRAQNRRFDATHQRGVSSPQATESQDVNDEFGAESALLRDKFVQATDKSLAMDLLVPWLSPVYHHTAVGLVATQIFTQEFRT